MHQCRQCKHFLVCFAKEKNNLIRSLSNVKNDYVVKHMHPCESFERPKK